MKKIIFLCLILTAFSCEKKDSFELKSPKPAKLIFPENNYECNQGEEVPGTNSTRVTFIWEKDIYADSYTLVLKNLLEQSESIFDSKTNELAINIEKATPYAWYIISYNSFDLETVQSDTWKFYNAGAGVTSYTPFPADAVFPEMAGTYINLDSIQLEWNGLDIDNDIKSYDVYFGTTKPVTTLLGNTNQNTMDVSVNPGNIYYWKVVTYDSKGNTSESEVFEFKLE